MLEKPKLSSDIGSITMKANKVSRKGNRKIDQKRFHDHYCLDGHLGNDDWDFTLFKQLRHKQLKERKTFRQHRLKTFYPLGLNEKEEYLCQHTPYMRIRQLIIKEFWLSSSFINFYQLFNYQFIQVCVLVYVCVYIWSFYI